MTSQFEVWTEVIVGTIGSVNAARQHIAENGIMFCNMFGQDTSDDIGDTDPLGCVPLEEKVRVLNLVKVSAKDLGLSGHSPLMVDIYAAAKKQKLSLCPAEVGLQLWLTQSNKIERGVDVHIAMDPFIGHDSSTSILVLSKNDHGNMIRPNFFQGNRCFNEFIWVFCQT